MLHLYALPPRLLAASFNPSGLMVRSLNVVEGINAPWDFNRDELRAMEIPAGNGTGDARSIAKLYGSAATGGSELGLSPNVLDAVKKPATLPTKGLRDKVLRVDTKYSLVKDGFLGCGLLGALSDRRAGVPTSEGIRVGLERD